MTNMDERPLSRLRAWIDEEHRSGIPFSHGAVLATQGLDGVPRSRMLGVYFCADGSPKFYTSPTTLKVKEIEANPRASMTFGFQRSFRSVTLEGKLSVLSSQELEEGWNNLDQVFRQHYLVFGPKSGYVIDSLNTLRRERDSRSASVDDVRPPSFIGYRFQEILRVVFYAVAADDFALCEEFKPLTNGKWTRVLRIP